MKHEIRSFDESADDSLPSCSVSDLGEVCEHGCCLDEQCLFGYVISHVLGKLKAVGGLVMTMKE